MLITFKDDEEGFWFVKTPTDQLYVTQSSGEAAYLLDTVKGSDAKYLTAKKLKHKIFK